MSQYRCGKCDKFKKPDLSQIGIGSTVSFTVATKPSSRTMRFSSKTGVVTGVEGDALTIKVKRGGTYVEKRQNVTPEGAPNALTYAFCGTCECEETGGTA